MNLILNGNDYHYALESLIRVFMPDAKIDKIYNSPVKEGEFALCETEKKNNSLKVFVRLKISDFDSSLSEKITAEDLYKAGELKASQLLFSLLKSFSSYTPQWGIQTGVRPTKIFFNLLRNNTQDESVKYLKEELLISDKKCALLKEVCKNEEKIISSSKENDFSLYISLPFCPTRCAYCSFISHSYNSLKKLIPDYVKLLCKEIEKISKVTKELGLSLRTVYIGGGTPTVLNCDELKAVLDAVENNFDLSNLSEFTVEAGRPDTLDEEKLKVLKNSPLTRLAINAQSLNDNVLKNIGRNHTAQDVYKAYETVRKLGFKNINTDLIAGLEGESVESFISSLNKVIDLGAENITVHTLALKRSSFLITRDDTKGKIISDTSQMIDMANEILKERGYVPYYLYRQSKSVGNLENTGWALKGKECEYNIFMMEEVHHVFGAGAGAVTRLVNRSSGKIERVYNFKYPYEYISDFDEMLERKNKAKQIIEKWRKP